MALPHAFDANTISDSSSSSSNSTDNEDEQQLEALFQRAAAQQQQPQQDDDRLLVKTMLESLGFQKKHIEKGMRLYEIQYGNNGYDADQITRIILGLQEKEAMKKQKKQLLAMNLDPQLAAELLGGRMKSKTKSKTSGYHRGDRIMYREKLKAQIMDKYDDYLLICWPLTKPLYQRAVLWVNLNNIKPIIGEKKKSSKTKAKSGLFSGMFGSEAHDKKEKKHEYLHKFEKLWRDLMVNELGKDTKEKIGKKKHIFCEMMDINLMKDNGLKIKSKLMKQTLNKYAVCGAYELYNETVTRLYNKRKESILRFALDSDDNKLNESKLWYVVSRRNVFKIINDGFRRKYGTMHAYGFGHAFYRNAHDALLVAQHGHFNKIGKDSDEVQYLLYCSVICGESCVGHKNMKIPNHKANKSYILYETSVDHMDLNENKYFITFQDYQAIPHYVICVKSKQVQRPKKHKKVHKNKAMHDMFTSYMAQQAAFQTQPVIKPDTGLPNIPNIPNYPQMFMQANQANMNQNMNQPPAPPNLPNMGQLFGGPPPVPQPQQQQQQHHRHHHQQQHHHHHQQHHHPPRVNAPPVAQQRRRTHRNRRQRYDAPPAAAQQQQYSQIQFQPQQQRHNFDHMQFRQMPPQFHYAPAAQNNNNNNNNNAAPMAPRLQPQQQQQQQQQQQDEVEENLFDSV